MILSITIPTYNRAVILQDCLSRLPDIDCDVIVSDNASTDATHEVVMESGEHDHRIRYCRLEEHADSAANYRNAIFNARGDLIVYLADDDSLLAEPLSSHVEHMAMEQSVVSTYTDSIAWCDASERELHRYYPFAEPMEFRPDDPLSLVNFVLETHIPPEVGIFRRDALINAIVPYSRGMPWHLWMYALSRQGTIRFDPLAFYREHRVLKPELQAHRGEPGNLSLAMAYMGDEQRLGLEQMVLLAMQDAGGWPLNDVQRAEAHRMIDAMLHNRTTLEIQRAINREDFILAVELRRRQALWGVPLRIDAELTKMAAQQALKAYKQLSNPPSLESLCQTYRIS